MPNFKTRLLASLIRLLPLWFHQRIGLSLMFILSLGLPCLVWLPLTRSLSVGAFDIRSYLGVFVVTFAHVVSLWISHLVLLLVFYSGHQRFGLHKPSSMPKWLKVIGDSSFFALLFPLPLTIFKISFDSDGFHFSFLLKVLAFFYNENKTSLLPRQTTSKNQPLNYLKDSAFHMVFKRRSPLVPYLHS